MNSIKVLHVGLSDNIGGIETVVRSWHMYLPDDIIFDFINNNEGELAFAEEFKASGAKIHKIPSRKENYRESYATLEEIIEREKYSYVHFHAMSLSWPEPILIAAKSSYTHAIIHSHTVLDNNISIKYRILHTIGNYRLRNTQYFRLACGENAGKSMFGDKKFVIIPNGIEINKFKFQEEKRKIIREKYGIPENTYVIGHVGRPGPTKNYPFIFEVFNELRKEVHNLRLLLIGNIENDSEIKRLLEKYDIRNQVIFAGFVKDCSDLYCAMDCFFFPSLYEGFSVSLIEAQASGLPCVVGNVAAETKMSERFYFININSKEEAKNKILEVFSHDEERENIQIENKYDIKRTSEIMFDYYRNHL